jgi:alpha-L-fucosidase
MRNHMRYLRFLVLLLLPCSLMAQTKKYQPTWESIDSRPMPAWFENGKFGIFIHWGMYSVPAWAPKGVYAEWYQHWLQSKSLFGNGKFKGTEVSDYHKKMFGENFSFYQFADKFTAESFEPDDWADIFKRSGAKYVVLTSKHHEGFALWPSKEASKAFGRPWNAMEVAAHRDVLGDLTTAVKKTGLKMGYYYSLYEWYNPMYQKDVNKYVDTHMMPQLKELVTNYKPDIIWPDGEWDQTDTTWKSREFLAWLYNDTAVKDSIVVNDRWGKGARHKHGGYYTTEYEAGATFDKPWEECRGIGYSFGYNRNEDISDYNSPQTLVLMLTDIISNGGNLLLDIGPDAHGKIPPVMQERLLQMGKWLDVNGEAIYDTRKWKQAVQWSAGDRNWKPKGGGYVGGDFILKQTVNPDPGFAVKEIFFTSKGNDVYAIVPRMPEGKLVIKNITAAKGTAITMLGINKPLKWKQLKDGIEVEVPKLSVNEVPCEYAYTFKLTAVK